MSKKQAKNETLHPSVTAKENGESTTADAAQHGKHPMPADRDSLYPDMSIPIEKRRLQEAEATAAVPKRAR
jgi:hypothetical protein